MANPTTTSTTQPEVVELATIDAGPAVLALVNQLASQLDPPESGDALFATQPEEPPPVAALRVLTLIRAAADKHLAYFASRARRAGLSWADMVRPLSEPDQEDQEEYDVPTAYGIFDPDGYTDLGQVEEHNPGLTAYWAAGGRHDVLVVWDCPSCRGEISDWGPTYFNPAEAELGHAEDCERFATAIREWEASQP
jgi:hypothetical protein